MGQGMVGTRWGIWAVTVAACSSPAPPATDSAVQERENGLAVAVRTPEGVPDADAKLTLGGSFPAYPDAAGFVFFLDVTPGRLPLNARKPAHAVGFLGPVSMEGALAAGSLELQPLTVGAIDDAVRTVTDGSLTVSVDPGVGQIGGEPVVGSWELGITTVAPERRWGMPGDLQVIDDDVALSPVVIEHAFAARGWQGEEELALGPGESVQVTVVLPKDSPLLSPSVEPTLYTYSGSETYWVTGAEVAVDRGAGTASFTASGLGWWGLGRPAFGLSCVRGRVADQADDPLLGALVALAEDGQIGVDRRTVDETGFCLPITKKTRADLRVLGFSSGRVALYRWSGEVVGGSDGSCDEPTSCVDVGLLHPDVFLDADQDLAWDGVGGDCDDEDPAINPSFATGDGSYCGGPLW